MANNRGIHEVVFKMILMVALAGVAASGKAQNLPEGKGKDIVEDVCSQCHSLRQVADAKMTAEEWKDTVGRMVSNGAPVAEDDVPIIVEYLAKSFPKEKTAARIKINKIAAKEIVDSLHLTAEEADAIVKYREEHGSFHAWEDLQKVAGVDLKKLEPVKDNLDY